MVFSEEVVEQAWQRSGGYCECRRRTHGALKFEPELITLEAIHHLAPSEGQKEKIKGGNKDI